MSLDDKLAFMQERNNTYGLRPSQKIGKIESYFMLDSPAFDPSLWDIYKKF